MDPKQSKRLDRVSFRVTEQQKALLRDLERQTGLSKRGVIKLALTEMAERRLKPRTDGRHGPV